MFCRKCGELVEDNAKFCPHCGATLADPFTEVSDDDEDDDVIEAQYVEHSFSNTAKCGKSKIAAALLAIFVGNLGVHNFYLGYTGKGIAQLLLTVIGWLLLGLGPLISAIWAFVEFILILMGKVNDSNGCRLVD